MTVEHKIIDNSRSRGETHEVRLYSASADLRDFVRDGIKAIVEGARRIIAEERAEDEASGLAEKFRREEAKERERTAGRS